MKTLYLLRHAKSSWDDPELKDFERPLNSRGQNDIPTMVSRFLARGSSVDCITCSPALRTKTTAQLFAKGIEFSGDQVVSNPGLYFAGTGMFLKAATLTDDDCDSALLVGHNPAITDFANAMMNTDIDNIPTCGLIQMKLNVSHWSEVELGIATLVEFDYPKKQ